MNKNIIILILGMVASVASKAQSKHETAISAILTEQAAAWNSGNLEAIYENILEQ